MLYVHVYVPVKSTAALRTCVGGFYQSREALRNFQWWLHSGGTLRSHIWCGETNVQFGCRAGSIRGLWHHSCFRFSPTVWTTSWEKTWRGWRRSGPTVGSGTSGGETNFLSLGAEVNVVHLELTSNCRCFLLAVSVFVASTRRPLAAVDAQSVCPRRSKSPAFSCLNKIASCQIYRPLILLYY